MIRFLENEKKNYDNFGSQHLETAHKYWTLREKDTTTSVGFGLTIIMKFLEEKGTGSYNLGRKIFRISSLPFINMHFRHAYRDKYLSKITAENKITPIVNWTIFEKSILFYLAFIKVAVIYQYFKTYPNRFFVTSSRSLILKFTPFLFDFCYLFDHLCFPKASVKSNAGKYPFGYLITFTWSHIRTISFKSSAPYLYTILQPIFQRTTHEKFQENSYKKYPW